MVKVSVIIPCYNVENYVGKCLESLLSQTFGDIEIICVNDGSTDKTLSILNAFVKNDKRIKIVNQQNGGLSNARNAGLKLALGEYIAFIDSDDWVDADFIEKLYNAALETNSDIAAATILRTRGNSKKVRVKYDEIKVCTSLEEKISACNIPKCCYVWNKLYKTELIKENKFKEGVFYEDILWTPGILKKSKRMVCVPGVNYYYRANPKSTVKAVQSLKKQKDSYCAKKELIRFFDENNLHLSKNEREITKALKYIGSFVVLKIKEIDGLKNFYLFGFLKIPNFVLCFLNFMKIFLMSIFSVSKIDSHLLVYLCGFQIRKRIKKTCKKDFDIKNFGLNKAFREKKIIASLTTFPERISAVPETIKAILSQTVKPDALVLWLAREQFPNRENELPDELLKLKDFGLEIKWCNDIRSFKKLIPALKEYPNDIIITFDDDIYYDDNVIENLYNSYLENPGCIHTNRSWRIDLGKNGLIKTKNAANMYWTRFDDCTYKNTIIGCGGVLYPPGSLSSEALNEEKFTSIIPTQDDVWFWAMAILGGTKIRVVSSYDMQIENVPNTQQYGLCKINKKGKKGLQGEDAFNLMVQVYPEILEKLKKEDIA